MCLSYKPRRSKPGTPSQSNAPSTRRRASAASTVVNLPAYGIAGLPLAKPAMLARSSQPAIHVLSQSAGPTSDAVTTMARAISVVRFTPAMIVGVTSGIFTFDR